VNFGGGFDGFVPLRTLRGDWWEMNEENTAIIAQGSGAVIHLGDAAKVTVDSVDKARGRVDLNAVALGAPATK
jgi:ribonuclease R